MCYISDITTFLINPLTSAKIVYINNEHERSKLRILKQFTTII